MQKGSHEKIVLALKPRRCWISIILIGLLAVLILAGLLEANKTLSDNSLGRCSYDSTLERRAIKLSDVPINAELAESMPDQVRGFSGRDCMADGSGMLFVYQSEDRRCFWMKDMKFSIDIIWLDDEQVISRIDAGVDPSTYPEQSFCHESRLVLEVPAGFSDVHKISPGDKLEL